jgi:hypothetical protein
MVGCGGCGGSHVDRNKFFSHELSMKLGNSGEWNEKSPPLIGAIWLMKEKQTIALLEWSSTIEKES